MGLFDRAYDRGRRDARLNAHDNILTRLELIQVSSSVAGFLALTWLSLSTQRLGDGAKATAASTIALAQALKEEKDTARDTLAADNTSNQSKWSKSQTLITAFGVMVAYFVGIGTFYLSTR